jgi:hypothetical protein
MLELSSEGRQIVDQLAQKYYVSSDAVAVLLQAVAAGNGYQAQFSHPDFGGMGQWQQNGMIMVGDMFNNGLKAKVSGLCDELSALLRHQTLFAPAPAQSQSQSSSDGVSLFVQRGGSQSWWPGDLGYPASTGAQNDIRYAYFPSARRLAIQMGGQTRVYDTGDHHIGGFSQQQGGDQSLTFTGQFGLVRVADLPLVSPGAQNDAAPTQPPMPPAPAYSAPVPPAPAHTPHAPNAFSGAGGDIFGQIEKLADLRAKNVLTEEEFSAKKAELLSRI